MTYMPTLQLTKISALLFFLQINPDPKFRQAVFLLIGICTTFCLAVIVADVFQCKPISKAWLGRLEKGGKCFDQLFFFRSTAVINIVLDFAILFLPMPMIWTVQRPMRQRVLLCLVFAVGIFVCIASIVRLTFWYRSGTLRSNPDATCKYYDCSREVKGTDSPPQGPELTSLIGPLSKCASDLFAHHFHISNHLSTELFRGL